MSPPRVLPLFLLAWPIWLAAASFDCHKAKSEDEVTVCRDARLSKQDDAMAEAYAQALKKGDKQTIEAEQKAWLKDRQACGTYKPCLEQAYALRIAQLQGVGVRWDVSDWHKAQGLWKMTPSWPQDVQTIRIQQVANQGFHFHLEGIHRDYTGEIEGFARITPRGAIFKNTAPENQDHDEGECQLTFVPLGVHAMEVKAEGCFAYGGTGMVFGGLFVQSGR
jgi:uncharacterized protein